MIKNNKELKYIAPTLIWMGIITIWTYFFAINRLDSDMSSELVLARELALENKLITSNWFYSTEIRVLNTQFIAMPLFKIFTSWKMIRVIEGMILNVFLLGSYLYCMKPTRIDKKYIYLSSMFLFIPFSMTYIDIVFIGHFYLPHYIMGFVSFGLFMRVLEQRDIKKVILYLFLAFICGISGVRYMLSIQIPVSMVSYIFFFRECKKEKVSIFSVENLKNKYVLLPSIGLLLSAVGYLINEKLLHQFFSFRSYENIVWMDLKKNNLAYRLASRLSDVLGLFGYYDGHQVMSASGIVSLFAIVSVSFIIVIVYQLIKQRRNLNINQIFIVLVFISSFFVNGFVFSLTDPIYQPRYFIVPLVLVVPVIALYFFKCNRFKEEINKLIAIGLSIVLNINGLASIYWTQKYSMTSELQKIYACLEANDLHFGYASFWSANVLTELSNGEIDVFHTDDFLSLTPNKWLMPKRYTKKDFLEETKGDEVFILMLNEEYEENKANDLIKKGKCIYQKQNYRILVYDKKVIKTYLVGDE